MNGWRLFLEWARNGPRPHGYRRRALRGNIRGDGMSGNPFAQSAQYQQLTLIAPMASLPLVETALEELAVSMAHFEHLPGEHPVKATLRSDYAEYYEGNLESTAEIWRSDIVVADMAARNEVETRLQLLRQSGVVLNEWHWSELQMRDWVSEIQSQFPPLAVGRFYIHGSHIAPRPRPWISLKIDAGCAFGTGEHATTSGCLRALEFVARKQRYRNILDLGCGTGILAIAAQKHWPEAKILGSDMDAVSVKTAQENSRTNMAPAIRFYAAAGFRHRALTKKYDLIFANILARPLIFLAGEIVGNLQPNGMAILSGLLTSQELDVLQAYRCRGMRLIKAFRHEGWAALVLTKPRLA